MGDTMRTLRQRRLTMGGDKGWSQAELAHAIGTTQSYISRCESGKVGPGLAVLERWMAALDMTVRPLERIRHVATDTDVRAGLAVPVCVPDPAEHLAMSR